MPPTNASIGRNQMRLCLNGRLSSSKAKVTALVLIVLFTRHKFQSIQRVQ